MKTRTLKIPPRNQRTRVKKEKAGQMQRMTAMMIDLGNVEEATLYVF
jgi:hypothetical protein